MRYRPFIGRRVVLNLTDGAPPVRGVLWRVRGPLLILKDSAVLTAGEATRIDGDLVVDRPHVAFMQVLP